MGSCHSLHKKLKQCSLIKEIKTTPRSDTKQSDQYSLEQEGF